MKAIRFSARQPIAAAALLALMASAQATQWTVQRLGNITPELNGGSSVINKIGRIAGAWSSANQDYVATTSGPNGTGASAVPLPANTFSMAKGINDAGQITGVIMLTDGKYSRPFVTDSTGANVTVLGDANSSGVGMAINKSGQVVGYLGLTGPESADVFLSSADGKTIQWVRPPAGQVGRGAPYGVNDAAQVAGFSCVDAACSTYHAFVTAAGGLNAVDLGTLGGPSSAAMGLNNSGMVVGYSQTKEGPDHAFATGVNGVGMRDLGTLGGDSSGAFGINANGQVVGSSMIVKGSSVQHAFITAPNAGKMIDLNSEVRPPNGGYFHSILGINDAGQVIGYADDGQIYLLTPKPNCSVSHKVVSTQGAYTSAELSITNLTTQNQYGWTAGWQFGSAVKVSSVYGGSLSVSSSYLASAKSRVAALVKPGATVKLTYIANNGTIPLSVSGLQAKLAGLICTVAP